MTRIGLGRLQLNQKQFDLTSAVREVVGRHRLETSQKGIQVTLNDEGPLVGCWDRLRIEQVVTNLLSNAIKYGEGKPIRVTTALDKAQSSAMLTIADQGHGIPQEMQKKIFERFERAGLTGEKISGLGLGLYIVHQIVEAHQGAIRVESNAGEGSVFTVTLPLHAKGTQT
jgi:signal transduction histidine kinase